MTDDELNRRAGLAAFSDEEGRVLAVDVEKFDPLHSGDDLLRLLIATGISFHRPPSGGMVAWTGDHSVDVKIHDGNELAAAARAACELAASWISDDDVKGWKIATGRN
ncbi:hypothetical protein LJR267_009142 [Paraburkholderia hospita]|uniref:hypothetical protein n=1 Tax=Paraburkholderia hospita TaxID=169430 RepID=UPI003ECFF39E